MEEGYKKLEVYRLALQLAVRVHRMTLGFPKFVLHEQGGQIRRSFLHDLYGSSEETVEHLLLLFETESLKEEQPYKELSAEYQPLNKMLFNHIQAVERTHETPAFLKEPVPEYPSRDQLTETLNPEA